MKQINYFLLLLILMLFTACKGTKTPIKEVPKETNTTKDSTSLTLLSEKQKIVKKELDTYLEQLHTFNTDAIVDMTYPKLFYVIDLDLYRQYIASMMNSTDIEFNSYETNVTKLSHVTSFSNGTEFAQVEYISKVKIRFLNAMLYDTEEKMNFLYDALIDKYGQENIKINPKERTLSIKKFEKLLVIKEDNKAWKFLGDNPRYRQLYPSFLPREILNNLDQEPIFQKQEKNIQRRDTNESNQTS